MTVRSAFVSLALALVCCSWQHSVCAQQETTQDVARQIRELKATAAQQAAKIRELEDRLAAQEAKFKPETTQVPPDLSSKIDRHLENRIPAYPFLQGLDVSGWVTTVVQGARNANGDSLLSSKEDITDSSYSANIMLEKQFGDFGWGLVHFQTGNGAGLTDDLKLYSNTNYDALDADDRVSVIEAWYEHYCKAIPLTVTFGKLDAFSYIDGNEYAWDETSQFLGDMFCNSPVIEWPSDNAAGALRLGWEPSKTLAFDFLAVDSDADGEDAYDALFLAGQLLVRAKPCGRQGNYRLILWRNNAPHTRWRDSAMTREAGWGWGLSLDQKFTGSLGGFFRYGWQDPDVYLNGESVSLEQSYSLGPSIQGAAWGRPDDTVGLGFGQVFASKKYKQANSLIAKPETHMECYYNFRANKYFTLSPDLQVIWRPYGKDALNGDGTIVVTGIRAELDF